MRKLLPLLLCCLLLTGCVRDPIAPMVSDAAGDVPAPAVAGLPAVSNTATLWFRYGEEAFLAPERRELLSSPQESYALRLLQALLEGPGAATAELGGLFPQGTQALSVTQSGRVMFVTLSRHIMNGYADEPANWRDNPEWATEVPLRRKLAMQSIAATLTENCEVDTVVILVEQGREATDSLRLRQGYYTLDNDTALADPLKRDEALLLTPIRMAEIILECWQTRDFTRLYRYVARTDPATAQPRPEEAAFVAAMNELPHLLWAVAEGGSVSADGQASVFTVGGAWLDAGVERPFDGMVLHLIREKGLWRVGLSELTGREALP